MHGLWWILMFLHTACDGHHNFMSSAFDQKKASILSEIGLTSPNLPDASPKGTIDTRCRPIMAIINAHPDMVTTSLCSGRVSVFLEGNKTGTQIGAKGNEGRWLFVSHDPENIANWYDTVDFHYETPLVSTGSTRYILFKFEPLILHVKCRDSATAGLLFSAAMGCGFRETGIGSNNIVGIRILIRLDVPIGQLEGDKLVLYVLREYLGVLSQLSLDRFSENFRKMRQLEDAIAKMGNAVVKDTKEQRRERMRKEGMERRDAVRAEKERKRKEKEEMERNQKLD